MVRNGIMVLSHFWWISFQDELGGRVTVAVNAEVDFYGSNDVVSFDQLLISCPAHVRFVFAGLRLPLSFDTAPASRPERLAPKPGFHYQR